MVAETIMMTPQDDATATTDPAMRSTTPPTAIATSDASAAPVDTAPSADGDASVSPAKAAKGSKRKKDQRTEEELALHAEFRAKKRMARKERKRNVKAAANAAAAEPDYYFSRGYRFVTPYVYEFRTHAKERWFGRTLLAMFTEEFGANSPEYYRAAIASGRITVNNKIVSPDTVIKNRDLVVHKAHRHEPPVSGEEVAIYHEDDEVLVVAKPPSMPTHPCGAYRHNSLHTIVSRMRPDLPTLNIVHRLDRLTSGIVILAKSGAKAKALAQCISDREASKTYLARVRGHLPLQLDDAFKQQLVATARANCAASEVSFLQDDSGADVIHVSCPLRCLSPRDAVWECHADGKESQTRVRVRRLDRATTLVECKPITGRTHQIRLHLQLLGFPIANDPCYGGELHFGESAERRAAIAVAAAQRETEAETEASTRATAPADFTTPQRDGESDDEFLRRTCPWCHHDRGADAAYNETQLHCARIWLHALEYKLGGHVFQVPEPSWAAPSDDY
ncbi:hypothetical protein ATCC90586_002106 [Pythium insidiosum]|nr:hypothetical protein ATCC90586_002106 [Pythium insidiosum]